MVAIYNSTIASRLVTADLTEITVEDRLSWFHEHSYDRRPLWIVENEEGAIMGWVSFQLFYGRPAYNETAEISIYLAPQFRGKGYGSTVLAHAIERCPILGIKTLLGYIFEHNKPSVQLFEKAGFDKWGLLPNIALLDGVERSVVIVGKRIVP